MKERSLVGSVVYSFFTLTLAPSTLTLACMQCEVECAAGEDGC